MSTNILQTEGLTRSYGQHLAVADFTTTVSSGEVAVLVGPNGCGKTTSVEMSIGLRASDGGTSRLAGVDVQTDRRHLATLVGVALQGATLHARVRIDEHLKYLGALYDVPEVTTIATALGLEDCLARPFGALSGGQQRRALVAAAFVGSPRCVVLDEPTSGIDLESRNEIWAALRAMLRERDAGVLVTTHDLAEAERHGDRVIVMRDGRIIADGTPRELVRRTGLRSVMTLRDPDGGLESALPDHIRRGAVVLATSNYEITLGSLIDRSPEINGMAAQHPHLTVVERPPAFEDAYLILARIDDLRRTGAIR